MSALGIVKVLLSLADGIVRWMQQRELITLGEEKNVAHGLKKTLANVDKAMAARRAVKSDPDSLSNDKYRRD